MAGPTDAEVMAFYHREESIRVRRRDPHAVNDAITATCEAFGIERSRVVGLLATFHTMRAG